jgi:hypothetical protein
MKTLVSICTALILLLPVSALSQRRPDWFTSGYYNFEINLPSRPANVEDEHFKLLDYDVYGETFEWARTNEMTASVSVYTPFKMRNPIIESAKADLIAAYSNDLRAEFNKRKVTNSELPYAFSGSKGVEIRAANDNRVISRLFFVGHRLFSITVSGEESAGFDPLAKVLDSFRLLTKTETIAALKWENDIDAVLQARPALLLGNDIQAAGLKGNVCSVVDEITVSASTAREIDRETYYDPSGNLVREVTYERGYPQEITQWGWIDGKRISSSRVIFYMPPEGISSGPALGTLGPTTGMMGEQGRNKIYGIRHEFVYDDKGRITEHKAFTNERALKWTKKFAYSATGREILTLDNTGGFLTRFFETFDKNGNIAEYKVLDMGGRPYGSTVRFVYEFDRGGNWIVRKAFPVGLPPAKKKPGPTHFRTIAYYE